MNPKPIPPGAFDLATRKDQICLKTSTSKNTLLPEDLHYKVILHRSLPGRAAFNMTQKLPQRLSGNERIGSGPVRGPCAFQCYSYHCVTDT